MDAASNNHVPNTEHTSHIYETWARVREEILHKPTPRQWGMLNTANGSDYPFPGQAQEIQMQ